MMSDLKEKWKIFNFVILKLCLSHIGYKCYLSWNSSLELLDLLGFESSSLMCCQIMWNPYFHPQIWLQNLKEKTKKINSCIIQALWECSQDFHRTVTVFTGFSHNCENIYSQDFHTSVRVFIGFSHNCENIHRIFTQLWESSQDFYTTVRVFTRFSHNQTVKKTCVHFQGLHEQGCEFPSG